MKNAVDLPDSVILVAASHDIALTCAAPRWQLEQRGSAAWRWVPVIGNIRSPAQTSLTCGEQRAIQRGLLLLVASNSFPTRRRR